MKSNSLKDRLFGDLDDSDQDEKLILHKETKNSPKDFSNFLETASSKTHINFQINDSNEDKSDLLRRLNPKRSLFQKFYGDLSDEDEQPQITQPTRITAPNPQPKAQSTLISEQTHQYSKLSLENSHICSSHEIKSNNFPNNNNFPPKISDSHDEWMDSALDISKKSSINSIQLTPCDHSQYCPLKASSSSSTPFPSSLFPSKSKFQKKKIQVISNPTSINKSSYFNLKVRYQNEISKAEIEEEEEVEEEEEEEEEEEIFLPKFTTPMKQKDAPLLLPPNGTDVSSCLIPQSIARHLMDHQVQAISWLWEKFLISQGAILGDDMGMGKTVTLIAFLSGLFQKTGLERQDKQRNKLRLSNLPCPPTHTLTPLTNSMLPLSTSIALSPPPLSIPSLGGEDKIHIHPSVGHTPSKKKKTLDESEGASDGPPLGLVPTVVGLTPTHSSLPSKCREFDDNDDDLFFPPLPSKDPTHNPSTSTTTRAKKSRNSLSPPPSTSGFFRKASIIITNEFNPPCLIVAPSSVLENWRKEFSVWGHFLVDVIRDTSELSHERIQRLATHPSRGDEVLLISYDLLRRHEEALSRIVWSVIIFDEGHELKNDKSLKYASAMKLKNARSRVMLTGTPIQNDIKELWALLNLVTFGGCHRKSEFIEHFDRPIKGFLSTKASEAIIQKGIERKNELQLFLCNYYLSRKKESLRGNEALRGKEDVIVFCDLSSLQKRLYQHVLSLPDFENVRFFRQACPCPKNQSRHTPLKRSECCVQYSIPFKRLPNSSPSSSPSSSSNCNPYPSLQSIPKHQQCVEEVDSRAVIWRQSSFHQNGLLACDKCPTCVLLPCMRILQCIASHPSLLQAPPSYQQPVTNTLNHHDQTKKKKKFWEDLDDDEEEEDTCGEREREGEGESGPINSHHPLPSRNSKQQIKENEEDEHTNHIQFVQEALSQELRDELGGPYRSSSFTDSSRIDSSGKMICLKQLLEIFIHQGHKSLVFSYSTKILDLIELFIKGRGWSFRRLDGSTNGEKRQKIVDEFNQDASIPLFLLSSKAGGLGLNLTSARNVIIFDAHWNPTVDQQSQDRCYRIGQREKVHVFRLISKGTIEEMIYMRQLYKQGLQNVALEKDHEEEIYHQQEDEKETQYLKNHHLHKKGKNKMNNNSPNNNDEVEGSSIDEIPRSFSSSTSSSSSSTSAFPPKPPNAYRNFEGVKGDASKHGELFGCENLFQYCETGILHRLRKKYLSASVDPSSPQSNNISEISDISNQNTPLTHTPHISPSLSSSSHTKKFPAGLDTLRENEAVQNLQMLASISFPSDHPSPHQSETNNEINLPPPRPPSLNLHFPNYCEEDGESQEDQLNSHSQPHPDPIPESQSNHHPHSTQTILRELGINTKDALRNDDLLRPKPSPSPSSSPLSTPSTSPFPLVPFSQDLQCMEEGTEPLPRNGSLHRPKYILEKKNSTNSKHGRSLPSSIFNQNERKMKF